MASTVSYELFILKQGVINGIATLDGNGKLPLCQLPAEAVKNYKGRYETSADLENAQPFAVLGDYAYVNETNSHWYWNDSLVEAAWVDQEIKEKDYLLLRNMEKAAIPYIIKP